jgi:hypothetical protein
MFNQQEPVLLKLMFNLVRKLEPQRQNVKLSYYFMKDDIVQSIMKVIAA